MVEFRCSNRWSLTTGSVEEEACSSSDRCSRPINARAAEEIPGSVTVGQLAEARTETGSSETITRLVGRPSAAACCRFRCSGIDSKAPKVKKKKKKEGFLGCSALITIISDICGWIRECHLFITI